MSNLLFPISLPLLGRFKQSSCRRGRAAGRREQDSQGADTTEEQPANLQLPRKLLSGLVILFLRNKKLSSRKIRISQIIVRNSPLSSSLDEALRGIFELKELLLPQKLVTEHTHRTTETRTHTADEYMCTLRFWFTGS